MAILSWAYACEKIVRIIGDELCLAVIEPVFLPLTGSADKHIFLLLCLFWRDCLYYFHILNQILETILNGSIEGIFLLFICPSLRISFTGFGDNYLDIPKELFIVKDAV